jgi:phosphohistidine phosphatase
MKTMEFSLCKREIVLHFFTAYIKKKCNFNGFKLLAIMIRNIIVVRHAKSDWENNGISDHERPLNTRGRRDIPLMASYLIQHYPSIDFVLSSDSLRTKETIEGLQKYGYNLSNITYTNNLYLASEDKIIDEIVGIDNAHSNILICGHNPGLSEFVQNFCSLDFMDMPSLGAIYIEVDIDSWDDIYTSKGNIVRFDYPKKK